MQRSTRLMGVLVRLGLLVTVLALGISAWPGRGAQGVAAQAGTGVLGPQGMKGASFVHTPSAPFGSPAAAESLRKLAATGANWVSVVVTFRSPNARGITFSRSANDPDDAGIASVVQLAHSLNMRVMLQPVVLLNDGVWNGLFYITDPTSAATWFTNYKAIITSYGQLAQQLGVDLFCIGTEFFTMTQPQYSANWRDVIGEVKRAYFGPLTYSANWGDKKTPEYNNIDWWDQLDYVGISAYFPLAWNNFTTEGLAAGWVSYRDPFGANAQGQAFSWFNALNSYRQAHNKPIIFTKIGFASYANSPGRWDVPPDPYLELSVQANAYEATMRVWGNVSWMQGIFWSPWYSAPTAGGPSDNGESPQGKPAEDVLRRWYGGR